jgi:hypothetical protein
VTANFCGCCVPDTAAHGKSPNRADVLPTRPAARNTEARWGGGKHEAAPAPAGLAKDPLPA